MRYSFKESDKTPLNQYDFTKYVINRWLLDNTLTFNYLTLCVDYFKEQGYNPSLDRIAGGTLKTARYIIENIQRYKLAYKNKHTLSELLTESNEKDSFWLYNNNKRYKPTQKLMDILEPLGLIYPISKNNYYFEIEPNNTLLICYQQIIGSRVVATITD